MINPKQRTVSLLVATDEQGFALYRVRGPMLSVQMGRHFSTRGDNTVKLASATVSGLYALPYKLYKKWTMGEQSEGKKLTVVLKSCDDAFLEQMARLNEIPEGTKPEWDILKVMQKKYDLKLKKVSDRGAAIENLKEFHKYKRPPLQAR